MQQHIENTGAYLDPGPRFQRRRESLTAGHAGLARQIAYMGAVRLACDMATNAMRRRDKTAPRLVPMFASETDPRLGDAIDRLIVWNPATRAYMVRVVTDVDTDALFEAMEVTA